MFKRFFNRQSIDLHIGRYARISVTYLRIFNMRVLAIGWDSPSHIVEVSINLPIGSIIPTFIFSHKVV